jgi:phosphoribosylformylglycinamidine synthase
VLTQLERDEQILLRYCDAEGRVGADANPNGSVADIAGIANARGNVLGLMPHPEHAVEQAIGNVDGLAILGSLADAVGGGAERGAPR